MCKILLENLTVWVYSFCYVRYVKFNIPCLKKYIGCFRINQILSDFFTFLYPVSHPPSVKSADSILLLILLPLKRLLSIPSFFISIVFNNESIEYGDYFGRGWHLYLKLSRYLGTGSVLRCTHLVEVELWDIAFSHLSLGC